MKISFKESGTYKNDDKNIIIDKSDIEAKNIFTFCETNAKSYIKSGKAILAEEIKEKAPDDDDFEPKLDKMNAKQLDEFAEDKEIDLGDAKNKAEKLEVIKQALETNTGDGE